MSSVSTPNPIEVMEEVAPNPIRESEARRVRVERYFVPESADVYELVGPWSRRDVRIEDATNGRVVFEQAGVEAPVSWSDTAVRVVASKYLRGRLGTPERESSVWTMICRISDSIADWGLRDGYLDEEGRSIFRKELQFLLGTQRLAFNSPVYFNVGIEERPQSSACFINSVDDSLESIMRLAETEGRIFKYGGGSGVNLSPLRGSAESLNGGGIASGPVSFMRGFDAFAGVIKSGGRTRRAAKIVVLDDEHPDVEEFVECKVREEAKIRALEAAGFGSGMDSDAYRTVAFQNANNSLRVSDAFMQAVESGLSWDLRNRRDGSLAETVDAREIWAKLLRAAWEVGDPGLQFADATNRAHTCPAEGPIIGSNPCGEFVFVPDSACNLASLNLRRFQAGDGSLDVGDLVAAVDTAILAQDILVDRSSYPTPEIERNSRRLRPLGLGYTNLGAFLMAAGLPYDSDEARATAAGVTSILTASAYRRSAEVAGVKGAFEAYERNADSLRRVLGFHASASRNDFVGEAGKKLRAAAERIWDDVLEGSYSGFRNAQVTLLAPTGTTSLMMDCDTTGVEPALALATRKELAGGGVVFQFNRSVDPALERLGYCASDRARIIRNLAETGSVGGVREEYLPVFDAALPAGEDGRSISWEGHVKMLAAVQPLLSGAISKTVNLPNSATVEDVDAVFRTAHRLDLKGVVVYRDGCRGTQPLRPAASDPYAEVRREEDRRVIEGVNRLLTESPPRVAGEREKLPSERESRTHKFEIAGHEGYVTAGLYPDGRLGELFVLMAKEGSTVRGLTDAWATLASIALQYGVPWSAILEKFRRSRFDPAGFTDNAEIGSATSPLDYVVRWVESRFPGGRRGGEAPAPASIEEALERRAAELDSGPPCPACGAITEPAGACHRCPTCGETTGCS